MTPLLADIVLPGEVVAGIAGVLGAVAYAIRKVVSGKPSAQEEARAVMLQGMREIHKEVRLTRGILSRLAPCAWAGGQRPKALDERLTRLRLELGKDAHERGSKCDHCPEGTE